MRISDWSSDVCSADLGDVVVPPHLAQHPVASRHLALGAVDRIDRRGQLEGGGDRRALGHGERVQRLAVVVDRKSVVWGKRVSVRVDLGGRRIINKKKK